jgi:hypothetical protein
MSAFSNLRPSKIYPIWENKPSGNPDARIVVGQFSRQKVLKRKNAAELEQLSAGLLLCRRIHSANQGDQIGRIFAHWAIVYFGRGFFSKITEEAQNFRRLFIDSIDYVLILTIMVWATFWAIFRKLIWSPCCKRGSDEEDFETKC